MSSISLPIVSGEGQRELSSHLTGHSRRLFRVDVELPDGRTQVVLLRVFGIKEVDEHGYAQEIIVQVWHRYLDYLRHIVDLPKGTFAIPYHTGEQRGSLKAA